MNLLPVNLEGISIDVGDIPREDIEIYLTAREGQAECFVSTNHKLVKAIVAKSGEFECMSPSDFVKKYL